MEVILLEKIHKLGAIGDKVNVANGYARNFLLPKQLAVTATPANIVKFEARRAELEQQSKDRLTKATARAEQIAAIEAIVIEARASDEGRLYGSINVREVAEAITAAGVEVKKQEIQLPEGPIRMVGEHEVALYLHTDVDCKVILRVDAEKATHSAE